MLTKCICTNCAGHLEFEEENAGEKISCPHCGFQTALFLPGTQPPDPELTALARKLARRRRVLWLGAAAALGAGLVYALWNWGLPLVQDLLPSIESKVVLWLALILICTLVPVLLLWLVFPILLCLQLRKLTQVLDHLADSLVSAARAPEEVEAELTGEENGEEEIGREEKSEQSD
jgi:hypothetical protein